MKIEVLGTGCAKCRSLLQNVENAIQETGTGAEIVKVDSLQEIMARGVMMVPALYVDARPWPWAGRQAWRRSRR